MWTTERHDRVTYLVSNGKGSGGVITHQSRRRWHAESDDTAATTACPSLATAVEWVKDQAKIDTETK